MCEHHDNTPFILHFDKTKPNETTHVVKSVKSTSMLTECNEVLCKNKKHYFGHENKANENKALSYCEALRYIKM